MSSRLCVTPKVKEPTAPKRIYAHNSVCGLLYILDKQHVTREVRATDTRKDNNRMEAKGRLQQNQKEKRHDN